MTRCPAEHRQCVQALIAREHELAPWDRRTIATLHARLAGGWPLTHHQVGLLSDVWSRITPDETTATTLETT